MNDLLINQALLASFVLSVCYAFALEQVHDWYSPNGIVFTVILGDGFILATLVYLEWRGVQKARQRVLEKFGRKLRAYKCEYGNHWHLTKQQQHHR